MPQTLLVQDLMTHSPRTVEVSKSLTEASRLMKSWDVRHLPVMDEGALVGLLSEREVLLMESTGDVALEAVMARAPWTVSPSTPVEVAARHMAVHKLGSAVVLDNERVVGIFTSTDGLRALADLLAQGRTLSTSTTRVE